MEAESQSTAAVDSGSKLKKMETLRDGALALSSQMKQKADSFTKSDRFMNMCQAVFDECDIDSNGSVDLAEIYCAVLLLYSKIVKVVKCASPPSKERMKDLMQQIDWNQNGKVEFEEFLVLSQFLFQEITGTITIQLALQFFFAPLVVTLLAWGLDHADCLSAPWWMPLLVVEFLQSIRNNIMMTLVMTMCVPRVMRYYNNQMDTHVYSKYTIPKTGDSSDELEKDAESWKSLRLRRMSEDLLGHFLEGLPGDNIASSKID